MLHHLNRIQLWRATQASKGSLLILFSLILTACIRPMGTPAVMVTAIPPATVQSEQVISAAMDTMLNKMVAQGLFSGAVLVARNGTVLLSKGYGLADREKHLANTPQTKFRIASLTKQFTAMAILILQAQGKLQVQDRICLYLTNCPAAWEAITIHQLLTHTAGIPNFGDFLVTGPTKPVPSTPTQIIARFKDQPLDFKPGSQWSYTNGGYIVLGAIIERVSGQSYEAFLQTHIFDPLRMVDTGYEHDKAILAVGYASRSAKAVELDMSLPYASGSLYSTVADLYRWDQALYTEQLVPSALLNQMFTVAAPIPAEFGYADHGFGYGYGWFIGKRFNQPVIEHEGVTAGFHSLISRYPGDKVTVILLSNQEDSALVQISGAIFPIIFGEKQSSATPLATMGHVTLPSPRIQSFAPADSLMAYLTEAQVVFLLACRCSPQTFSH